MYSGKDSFDEIGHDFVKRILKGDKPILSNRSILEFFTVNLWNFEYY
jgi:hypothetical protein